MNPQDQRLHDRLKLPSKVLIAEVEETYQIAMPSGFDFTLHIESPTFDQYVKGKVFGDTLRYLNDTLS